MILQNLSFNRSRSVTGIWSSVLFVILSLVCTSIQGQISASREPAQAFQQWNSGWLKEKVFLHSDREAYLAGEILWFKGYVLQSDLRLSDLSKVLYVELLNAEHRPVLQAGIALKQGTGKGSFYLPAQLPAAVYELRAYTSLMKNDGAGVFFSKKLRIYNTQDDSLAQVRVAPKKEVAVRLFPEGGYLVDGLEGRIGCTVTGADQRPLEFRGAVLNALSDTLVRFSSLKAGIGSFAFKPDPGVKYRVLIEPEGSRKIIQDMPGAEPMGCAMRLTDDKAMVRIRVDRKGETTGAVHLIAHARNQICFKGSLSDGSGEFVVEKRALKDGVNCFTLFDESGRPVGERLFFKAMKDLEPVSLKLSNLSVERRTKVTLDLNAADSLSRPLGSDLSLAVYYSPANMGRNPQDIRSYICLESELQGQPEWLDGIWETELDNPAIADLLMLCSQPKGVNWTEILKTEGKQPELKYIPDYDGQLVFARLTNGVSSEPIPNTLCFLSVPGSRVQLSTAISNKDGLLIFNCKGLYGHNELVLQAPGVTDIPYKFELMSPFMPSASARPLSLLAAPARSALPVLRQLNINMQVSNAFFADKLRQVQALQRDSTAFFGQPDKTYLLDDYTRFATTEEVLREYIPEIWLQRRDGRKQMSVVNQQSRLLFQSEPLMMLDGVPFFLTDKILKYDPLKIRSIDIVTSRYFWGPSSFDGIVHFKTYKGNLDGYQLDPGDQVVDYEGLLEQRKFYMPEYRDESDRSGTLPDFRNLLFWAPDVRTNTTDGKCSLSFYTSDQKGTYSGCLQGVTADGTLVSKRFSFEVK